MDPLVLFHGKMDRRLGLLSLVVPNRKWLLKSKAAEAAERTVTKMVQKLRYMMCFSIGCDKPLTFFGWMPSCLVGRSRPAHVAAHATATATSSTGTQRTPQPTQAPAFLWLFLRETDALTAGVVSRMRVEIGVLLRHTQCVKHISNFD